MAAAAAEFVISGCQTGLACLCLRNLAVADRCAKNHELMAAVMADHVNVAYGNPMQHWAQDAMYVRRVQELILNQVNYYFSTENLCKDEFLRVHMDGEGWVPIPLLASFARLRRLTTDLAILTEARGATALQLLHTTPSPPLPCVLFHRQCLTRLSCRSVRASRMCASALIGSVGSCPPPRFWVARRRLARRARPPAACSAMSRRSAPSAAG